MSEEIFRKKSLDKVKSPESLDEYIRVSSPGVWLLLISVIVLLAGACVWGVFGRVNSTLEVVVLEENGTAVCTVAEENITSVKAGLTVKVDGQELVIESIGEKNESGYSCVLTPGDVLADGFHDGKIVLESYKPLSFILN